MADSKCLCGDKIDEHAFIDMSVPFNREYLADDQLYAQAVRDGVTYAVRECQVRGCLCRKYVSPRGSLGR